MCGAGIRELVGFVLADFVKQRDGTLINFDEFQAHVGGDRLNGRVTRLFVGPLLKALKSVLHRH